MPILQSLFSGLLLGAMMGLAGAAPAAASPAGKEQASPLKDEQAPLELRKIEDKLGKASARRKELEKEIEALRAEKKSLVQALVEVAARIQGHEAQMSAAEKRLAKLELENKILIVKLQKRRETLADMLAALQKLEQHPPPAIIVKPGNVLDAIRSAMLLSKAVPEIRAEANALSRELIRMVRLREDITTEKQRLEQNAKDLDKERLRIGNLLELKKELVRRTRNEAIAQSKYAQKLAKEARNLKDLIARLKEQARISAQKAKAAREQKEKKAAEAKRILSRDEQKKRSRLAMLSPSRLKPALPFEKTKGHLAYPAQGQPVRLFGDAEKGGDGAQGITIKTRKQAQVISPNDGWVVYAGEFRGYGQLLIVDGGSGYHVLLAGMARISVDVGQFVLAGEPVGTMGDHAARSAAIGTAEGSDDPLLYVEFRKNGNSIDPGPWWAGKIQKAKG
jgi:septal ring factor EnvC (AmiA/AmiB activator)